MTPLSPEFVENCPVEKGFRMRGLEMTRLEVFVDAAFAFALTMLVISFDAIPGSYDEIILAIKNIPAFVVAVIQLLWIWNTHNIWSRRFGLDTTWTVVLSAALLIVMLIYIYPMRIMAGGMFSWFTGGYLPSNFMLASLDQLRSMFVFLGIGFVSLCLVFVLMYRYAARLSSELLLSPAELHETGTVVRLWFGSGVIGGICVALALSLPEPHVPMSGFAFFLLAAWFPLVRTRRWKSRPPEEQGVEREATSGAGSDDG
jgi:hypothetical protein